MVDVAHTPSQIPPNDSGAASADPKCPSCLSCVTQCCCTVWDLVDFEAQQRYRGRRDVADQALAFVEVLEAWQNSDEYRQAKCELCLGEGRLLDGAGDTKPCECQPSKDREPESYE